MPKRAYMTDAQLTPEQAKSIGELLKSAREKQAKNIADVAYQIALSPAQLRAIEAADLRPFYSPNFFYQAAQRYARVLDITLPALSVAPPAELVTQLASDPPAAPPVIPESPKQQRIGWKPLVLAASLALIAIGLLISQQQTSIAPAETANASVAVTPPNVPAPTSEPNNNAVAPTASAPATNTPAAPAANSSATASAQTLAPKTPANSPEQPDSLLESASTAWVQIVKKNGEKTNLKIEPGQKIEFASINTAAIVFGQPDKARLLVKGKAVDLNRFVTADNPSRALVVLNQIP